MSKYFVNRINQRFILYYCCDFLFLDKRQYSIQYGWTRMTSLSEA